jgi:hypothetical protein
MVYSTRQVAHSSQNFIGQPQSSKYDPVHDVQPQSSGYSLEQAQNLKYGDEQLQRTPLVHVLVVLNKLAKTFGEKFRLIQTRQLY